MCLLHAFIVLVDCVEALLLCPAVVCKMEPEEEVGWLQLQLAVLRERNRLARIRLLFANLQRHRRRRRPRRWWCRPWLSTRRREKYGLYDQLMVELRREDTETFRNFMRMPPEMFDEILDRVGPRLRKKYTNFRLPLEPGMKLAITLRHLASGNKYRSMRFAWRVPHNTISLIVKEVCQAIFEEYVAEAMPVPTRTEQWQSIADGFMNRWQFPNTLGALDGKHVACKCPPSSGSLYFNYKKFFSVVLLALVDSDYKFVWADVGGRGAASDAQLWNMSDLKRSLEDPETNQLNIPPPAPLPNDTQDVPFFIIADDAFGLKPSLMKPYSQQRMSRDERIFNYRLSRGRRVVENAFGILANRFQVLLTTMQQRPPTIRLIVTACLILHNIMRKRYPGLQNPLIDQEDDANGVIIPGEWRNGRQMRDCRFALGHNRDNREGKKQRNLLKHWANSPAGTVEWQDKMVP